jgi:hypothetical protein
MISSVIFWGALLFGVPLLVGQLVQFIIAAILEMIIGERWKRLPDLGFDFVAAIAGSLFACALAGWLGQTLNFFVPLWLMVLISIYLTRRREWTAIPVHDLGIALGYVLWIRVIP